MRSRGIGAALLTIVLAALGSGCLVLSVNPGYDEATLGWDPRLVGTWTDADDKASLQIERGEWKSYRIHYVHPIETGDLTALPHRDWQRALPRRHAVAR